MEEGIHIVGEGIHGVGVGTWAVGIEDLRSIQGQKCLVFASRVGKRVDGSGST